MLGNIIGGFIVILVGEQSAHYESNLIMQNPEYRLTSSRGQDRSVNVNSYALTTDKGNPRGWIYSLNSNNKKKLENNIIDCFITNRCPASWVSSS
jgi:hypothetical protein